MSKLVLDAHAHRAFDETKGADHGDEANGNFSGRGQAVGAVQLRHRRGVPETGDVVRVPPGVKHWHCATATSGMTHIALTGAVGSENVGWLEKVSDEQYRKR